MRIKQKLQGVLISFIYILPTQRATLRKAYNLTPTIKLLLNAKLVPTLQYISKVYISFKKYILETLLAYISLY